MPTSVTRTSGVSSTIRAICTRNMTASTPRPPRARAGRAPRPRCTPSDDQQRRGRATNHPSSGHRAAVRLRPDELAPAGPTRSGVRHEPRAADRSNSPATGDLNHGSHDGPGGEQREDRRPAATGRHGPGPAAPAPTARRAAPRPVGRGRRGSRLPRRRVPLRATQARTTCGYAGGTGGGGTGPAGVASGDGARSVRARLGHAAPLPRPVRRRRGRRCRRPDPSSPIPAPRPARADRQSRRGREKAGPEGPAVLFPCSTVDGGFDRSANGAGSGRLADRGVLAAPQGAEGPLPAELALDPAPRRPSGTCAPADRC